jgi:NitT/TauT family transport system ATP-binding protein
VLSVSNLKKIYGAGDDAVEAIGDLTLTVEAGEFVSIVGPSGCGKTTLLRCMAGLLEPTSGTVELRGKRISEPPPEMGVVFQDYSRSLMPWLSVRKNVELPLKYKPLDRARRDALVADALESVGLTGFDGHYPWQLSGGMQQRVAIARAVAYEPQILLMDEPFASVDAQTRADLEDLVMQVQANYGMTVVFVTHDIDESVYLSDRVVVLSGRPTVVLEVAQVPLRRPRDQIETKELPEFGHLRGHVYRLVRRSTRESRGQEVPA